ncbi:stress response translation initiation inhibitor YciH [Aliidiomarina haloalkalitolerans]|mgnify:CR=1 FL=1|uniref:Stress response translation initiation inhibitor YciH n=1 Tax=Aliidiomarina haloalkalitolerans TaxID=859059 RepID=A0A432VXX3_9GAMM|nr:stress response translation initiation inhibitor YciH [Aliidiomarina haloalkalitolerans]RUO21425.1 stress response translation initiation inhibitor YciH [Aliidiomarina haloalkalitolerans]
MSLRDQLSTLVYSTDAGRIEPEKENQQPPKGDGIVRIQRETKGRKGKGVTVIRGLELDPEALKTLAKALKQRCGVGGSVKEFTIEIQGDQRDACKAYLEQQGFKVKLAGG